MKNMNADLGDQSLNTMRLNTRLQNQSIPDSLLDSTARLRQGSQETKRLNEETEKGPQDPQIRINYNNK